MFLLPGSSIRGNSHDLKKRQCKPYQGKRDDLYPYRDPHSPSYRPDPSGDICSWNRKHSHASALVLPGISASQMLYMLGIYESTLKAISSLDILALLPLAVGGILGTYLTARILEQLIKKHREDTFLIILGFMLVSLRSLLPEHLIEENLLAGVGALVLGFVSLYFLSAK